MSQGNIKLRASDSNNANQQIVHMKGDSDSSLDLLFSVLKKVEGQPTPTQSSYRHKILPSSFFTPPQPGDRGNHSRESSQDSTSYALTQTNPGLPIAHARSQSSPAQLPRTLSAAPPPHHMKQQSVDLLEENIAALQPGWDVKQRYFPMNSPNQQNQWQSKSLSNTSLNSPQQTLSPNQSLGTSPNVSLQDLGPLPAGWEQGMTAEGEIYYINHMEKATSWFDPRIQPSPLSTAKHLQRPGPMKVPQVQHQLRNPPDCQLVQQQQTPQLGLLAQPASQQAVSSPQQQLSPNNHPLPPPPPQQTQPQQMPNRKPVPNEQYIKLELQKLEREKERLRREQEEIQKRELKLQELLKDMASVLTTSTMNEQVPGGMGAQSPMHATGVDPFLGHVGIISESHARQNSGDSGLGMSSYSLPRTPEDILSNVDEMDTHDGGKQLHKNMNSDCNMNDLQGTMTGIDMNICEGTDNTTGMDSEDLVPSLQEDISSELLSDMEVQKMENLLWL